MIGDGEEDESASTGVAGALPPPACSPRWCSSRMVFMVKFANDARENALDAERHSYEVALIVRNASANISGAEAALARFVLDEDVKTNGNIYASEWQLAGYQIQQACAT